MHAIFDPLLVVIMLLNLFVLSTSRLRSVIGASALQGVALGVLTVIFSETLPLIAADRESLILPSSFATVLTGFIILTTRRKAITQVVGYLILENGIFIMGLALLNAMPFLVEVGVLLDLFVAIFVMGIIINHISREFRSTDVARLSSLKEE